MLRSHYFKKLFHRNSIALFSTLEKLGIPRIRKSLQKELKMRSRFRLTQVHELSKAIPLWYFMFSTPEVHKSNDWYGHASILKKYAGLDKNSSIMATIEHGFYFGNYQAQEELSNNFPVVLTLSKRRERFLKSITDKRIVAIGPYIYYSPHFLTKKQTLLEKKRLGKCLLAFPIHSTGGADVDYSIRDYCQKLAKLGKEFDTIRVCLYWRDVLKGLDKQYISNGFECVTAGHIFDPLFLPRLKSIIDTSTITTSNSVGTQLGYCIMLNKPHFIFKQKLSYSGAQIDVGRSIFIEATQDYKTLEGAFGKFSWAISTSQYDLISHYWGFDEIKTKKELQEILANIY